MPTSQVSITRHRFYWAAPTIVPLLGPAVADAPREHVAISTDATERKRLEQELAIKLRLQRLLGEISTRIVDLPPARIDSAIEASLHLMAEALVCDQGMVCQWSAAQEDFIQTHSGSRSDPENPFHCAAPAYPFSAGERDMLLAGGTVSFSNASALHRVDANAADFPFARNGSLLAIPLFANEKVFGVLVLETLQTSRVWREDEIAMLKVAAQLLSAVLARKQAEERAEQMRAEMTRGVRMAMLGEVAAALAHELNQPLTAILVNAQAARRFLANGDVDLEELNATLNDIIRDDKRAGAVIHNLRAMLSNRPVERERCSLNDLVNAVLELLRSELMGHRVQVCVRLDEHLPLLEVSRVELQQVIVNLVLNAEHAMKDTPNTKRLLEIETSSHAGSIVLTVRDHGCGLPPDLQGGEVFAPFVSTKEEGLGIGLSICARIVQNHAGQIVARNHPSGGAVFTVTLPVVDGVGSDYPPKRR